MRFMELERNLKEKDWRIGYSHVHDSSQTAMKNTKYGEFVIGSPLSFHLAPNEFTTKVVTNIPSGNVRTFSKSPHSMILPIVFHDEGHDAYPKDWVLDKRELTFLQSLCVTSEASYKIESETIKQRNCTEWFYYRKNRITSSNAHMICTRGEGGTCMVG